MGHYPHEGYRFANYAENDPVWVQFGVYTLPINYPSGRPQKRELQEPPFLSPHVGELNLGCRWPMAFKSGIIVKDMRVKLYQLSVAEEIDAYKIVEGRIITPSRPSFSHTDFLSICC